MTEVMLQNPLSKKSNGYLSSFGLMVQKQKFSASTWLDVNTLKKVDLLEEGRES